MLHFELVIQHPSPWLAELVQACFGNCLRESPFTFRRITNSKPMESQWNHNGITMESQWNHNRPLDRPILSTNLEAWDHGINNSLSSYSNAMRRTPAYASYSATHVMPMSCVKFRADSTHTFATISPVESTDLRDLSVANVFDESWSRSVDLSSSGWGHPAWHRDQRRNLELVSQFLGIYDIII